MKQHAPFARVRHPWPALSWLLVLWLGLLPALPAQAQVNLVLAGSGEPDFMPDSWTDAAFKGFLQKAGFGRILILTARTETDRWPRYLRDRGAASAEHLSLPHRCMADSPETYAAIEAADGLIIAGGHLWQQITLWAGTRAESAIRDHVGAGKPLAGLGEGAMALGRIIADRRHGPLPPPEALRRPGSDKVTFTEDYLGFLDGVIIEPAFTRQGRLPPLLLAMARHRDLHPTESTAGIGIDERTAIVIDQGETATIVGEGTVTVLQFTASSVVRLDPRLPPVMTEMAWNSFTEGYVFHLPDLGLLVAPPAASPVPAFPAVPLAYQALDLDGSATGTIRFGPRELTNLDRNSLALQLGLFGEIRATDAVPRSSIMPLAFADPDYWENRVGGLLWTIARYPDVTGILLEKGGKAEITTAGHLSPLPTTEQPSMMVFDPRGLQLRSRSRYRTHPESKDYRQSVGLVGLKLHLLTTHWGYVIPTGQVVQLP